MVWKKDLTAPSKRGAVHKHAGKGSRSQVLPSRHALSSLTSGDPAARTMNDYAKYTPMANPNADSPDIQGMSSGDWGGDTG